MFAFSGLRRASQHTPAEGRLDFNRQTGALSWLERRTLPPRSVRRWLAPVRWRSVGREPSLFADWYNGQRAHAGLAGATPDAIYFGQRPAHHRLRFEPRARWPRPSRCARPPASVRGRPGVRLVLEVRYLEGRADQPVVTLTRAA